jgi:hypothetical protein
MGLEMFLHEQGECIDSLTLLWLTNGLVFTVLLHSNQSFRKMITQGTEQVIPSETVK